MSLLLAVLLAGLSTAAEPPAAPAPNAAGAACEKTGLIVPAYFNDGPEWNKLYRLLAQNPSGRAIVIINPYSGPGGLKQGDYPDMVAKYNARIRKIRSVSPKTQVIGYAAAGYLESWRYFGFGRDLVDKKRAEADSLLKGISPDDRKAMSASVPGLSNDEMLVLLAVREDMRRWRAWYPELNGLFIDEAPSSGGLDKQGYLAEEAAKLWGRDPVLVYNPGTRANLSQFPRASSVCQFESSKGLDAFMKGLGANEGEKTCVLLYGASRPQADQAWQEACAREVAWFYVTERQKFNPWLRLSVHLGVGSAGPKSPR